MYQTNMPSISKLLNEGARVTRPGGIALFTSGSKVYAMVS
jgi:ubiquinone/menaquinone biosynthesis C-methylase UbiE